MKRLKEEQRRQAAAARKRKEKEEKEQREREEMARREKEEREKREAEKKLLKEEKKEKERQRREEEERLKREGKAIVECLYVYSTLWMSFEKSTDVELNKKRHQSRCINTRWCATVWVAYAHEMATTLGSANGCLRKT